MKTYKGLLIILMFGCFNAVNAQFLKKLGEKAEKAAERTIERRVEKKASEKTDDAMDEVLEGKKAEKKKDKKKNKKNDNSSSDNSSEGVTSSENNQLIVTGSTFFPEGNIIFEEKFSQDNEGDFPSNWDTNAGGEIIKLENTKALRLYPNGLYITSTGELPENYALEFDLTTANLKYDNLAGSRFEVQFVNEHKLKEHLNKRAKFSFSLWKESSQPNRIHIQNYGADVSISNHIDFQMVEKLNTTTHFTCVVNKKRFRLYIDNEKVLDLPSLLEPGMAKHIQFSLNGTNMDLNHIVALSNIKITEEGEDIRSMILKGGFSTTKILFDSGSDKLTSSSYGFLDKVGKALESDPDLKVTIIGHTDSDGDTNSNLELSKKRAASVKAYLTSKYKIAEGNLQTDGKGESKPAADNTSAEGKAKNRRVEFIKI